jgi:hypothetical protein
MLSVLLLTAASAVPAAADTAAAAPTISYLSPFPGSYVRTGASVTIEVRVGPEIDHVVVHDGRTGEELTQLSGEPRKPWRYVWSAAAGSVSPTFTPVSTAGVIGASRETGYRFDDEPPVVVSLSFQISTGETLPVNGRVGPAGLLNVGALENSWLINTVWSVDGVVVPGSGLLEWSYPPRSEPYLVRVQLMDGAGNWGERTFPLTVDATNPVVSSVTPANGALVRGSRVHSSLRASDASGINWAELTGAERVLKAPYAASLPAGKDGTRTLTWQVQDTVGNITVVRRTVTVDNTKAKLAFAKAPKHKAKVKGTVTVAASASDRYGIARVQLLVNGKVVTTDTKAAYKFTVNTRKYSKKIKIQLYAYDKAGNVTKTSTRTWSRG